MSTHTTPRSERNDNPVPQVTCPRCEGRRTVWIPSSSSLQDSEIEVACDECHAHGTIEAPLKTAACGHCAAQYESAEGRTQCPTCGRLNDVVFEQFIGVSSKKALDFTVANHGSICVLTGQTENCREWIEENVGNDETQTWGQHGIVVEPRYIQDIVNGLEAEGFIGANA